MQIRNFVIISHVDHGKSTLADRFLELTGTVDKRKMREQYLDMMALEREKGITIKMAPVRMLWRSPNSSVTSRTDSEYILNLIDTPGHADFSYEVSRALAAVEGALLLVDATEGIQAQTLASLELAQKEGLVIIPVINKIDLPSAEIEKTAEEVKELLGDKEIYKISAKTGQGVEGLLSAMIKHVPPPDQTDKTNQQLRALIFDSAYDPYLGAVAHVRIFDGLVNKGEKLKFLASGALGEALELGVFLPECTPRGELRSGEIGYIATGIKEPEQVRVGDTITNQLSSLAEDNRGALPGYREPEPMVYASIFPENQDDFETLQSSLKKLKLNDASLYFEPEESGSFGRGFRAGFLGMLHMEIVAERIKREYGLNTLFTNPSVAFKIKRKGKDTEIIYVAAQIPEEHEIESLEEPWVEAETLTPAEFLGTLTLLINERGGKILETAALGDWRLLVKFEAPLREIIVDFYDRLKNVSQGFASLAYSLSGFRPSDLVRLDILVAGERIAALSEMVVREKAYLVSRARVTKLKRLMSRELFPVSIQAALGGKIIARETIPALKKDVAGYLYGGDRTRKMKLWKKQKQGKKKLTSLGKIKIPRELFWKMANRV